VATTGTESGWLTCQELIELVTEYFEGAMPPADRLRFEEHIAVCPPCRAHLRQMRETIRLLGELTEENIPAGARDELLSAFRDWKRSGGPGRPDLA
jgi:anti-sigma factor RsiW